MPSKKFTLFLDCTVVWRPSLKLWLHYETYNFPSVWLNLLFSKNLLLFLPPQGKYFTPFAKLFPRHLCPLFSPFFPRKTFFLLIYAKMWWKNDFLQKSKCDEFFDKNVSFNWILILRKRINAIGLLENLKVRYIKDVFYKAVYVNST